MAVETITPQDCFIQASTASDWYKNLGKHGSCLKLYDLLVEDPQLFHQTGQEGVTVLHKGVKHGCVKLVRHVLVDMFDAQGNCICGLDGRSTLPCLTREELLRKTCSEGVTAVHMAIVSGSPRMVLLLKWAIEMSSYNKKYGMMAEQNPTNVSYRGLFEMKYSSFDEMEAQKKSLRKRLMNHQIETNMHSAGGDAPVAPEVPEVTDEGIDGIYDAKTVERMQRVYGIIEGILENPIAHKEVIEVLKEECKKDVNFEFSPIAHVFLHFLSSELGQDICYILGEKHGSNDLYKEIIGQFINSCNRCDHEDGGIHQMMETLCNLHDPQGRTFFLSGLQSYLELYSTFYVEKVASNIMKLDAVSPPISPTTISNCVNGRDTAGRTFFHYLCIYELSSYHLFQHLEKVDLNAKILPIHGEELKILIQWCFPEIIDIFCDPKCFDCQPIHLMTLFNTTDIFDHVIKISNNLDFSSSFHAHDIYGTTTPLQIAASLGRPTIIQYLLEHHSKYNSLSDPGLGNSPNEYMRPAILCAAKYGQIEAIQSILKYPIYDPVVETQYEGTALHVAVEQSPFIDPRFNFLKLLASMHTLPNSQPYKKIQNDIPKSEVDQVEPRMYSTNQKSCINLLLHAGIDIWTQHPQTKQFPMPGPTANDEAHSWWYNKVVREVGDAKNSIRDGANAASVVAALVATGSYIGPFQPPLGYSSSDGYIEAFRTSVQIYLVCNSLSFFFSVSSILMAILPAIPMPKESLYDELLRGRRCLKTSAFMLLISIICILISFSSASIAVVSSDWQQRQFVVACISCGGGVCMVVLAVYVIRLMRMLFHKNHRIRRSYKKYMYF